jgi:hypothetical protein
VTPQSSSGGADQIISDDGAGIGCIPKAPVIAMLSGDSVPSFLAVLSDNGCSGSVANSLDNSLPDTWLPSSPTMAAAKLGAVLNLCGSYLYAHNVCGIDGTTTSVLVERQGM